MKQLNLDNMRNDLTESDIDQIISIIGHRCRIKTVNRLRSIITYDINTIGSYGIYSRLIKEGDNWSYCAGQSYPDEIRTIRECILGKV